MTRGLREHRHDPSLAAGAVLGDLAVDEHGRWSRLRQDCAECRALEIELDAVVADLALSAPAHRPPQSLLAGIRAAIHAEPDRA